MSYCNFNMEGFVTKDADVRFTRGGKRITSFSIAINMGKDEKKTAHYLDCCVWEYKSEINKGMLLKLDGYVKTDKWQDKEGHNRSKVIFVAKNIEVLPVNRYANSAANTTKSGIESLGETVQDAPQFDDSFIPF
jgi:single-strand DNA-binding protein